MSSNNIFGSHSVFYYYSKEHLFINLLRYIKNGLENNELVYLLIDKNSFQDFTRFLKKFNMPTDNVHLLPIEKFNCSESNLNTNLAYKKLKQSLQLSMTNGFSGIRLIEDCSHVINTTSKNFFIDLEKNINTMVKLNNISVLCTYDVYDYIQDSSDEHLISKDILYNSFHSHSHILNKFNLSKIIDSKKAI